MKTHQLILNLILTLLACSVCAKSLPAADRPNVVIVLTDDQGYGDFSCHGNPVLKTPQLDRLHTESIRLTDFHSAPMCTPTRGQLLTGRDAMDNGATMVCLGRSMVREELPTMADLFSAAGYSTVHYGKWHLGDSYPYRPQDRGFQETIHHGAWGITSIPDYFGNDYWDDTYRVNDSLRKFDGYCTDVWFDLSLEYIRDWTSKDKPYFLYLETNCPHSPHWVDDEYSDSYVQAGMTPVVSKFFGQIANIDDNMGRLLDTLEETGQAENTLLIYMTDNGTVRGSEVFNAGMRGRKTQLWEGGHRVPLFVRWPNGNLGQPRDIDVLTHCQDLLPTLIELCELPAPPNPEFDGVTLAGLLRGTQETLDDRMLVVSYGANHDLNNGTAVMWNKWRLLGNERLYDLTTDPHQDVDVAQKNPAVLAAMQTHYTQWWEQTRPQFEKTRYIHLGTESQNPMMLYSSDWQGSYADNYANLLAGDRIGYWDVIIESAGEYEFTLSRWHPVANLPLNAALRREGQRPAGAVPIAQARIRVGEAEFTERTAADQTEVKFTLNLEAGKNRVFTWFLDENGEELCSAYYTHVHLK